MSIYSAGDAGVLSLSSAIMGAGAVTVRVFTVMVLYLETSQDKRDSVGVIIGILMALVHYVITYQVFIYSYQDKEKLKEKAL